MDEKEAAFFEQLYSKYKKLMFSQALLYSASCREDAEDIVHDTLVKLMSKYKILSGLNEKALASYIVYSIRNTAINRRKHLAIENKYYKTYNPDETYVSAESQLLSELPPEDLFPGWAKLSQKDRDLLAFRYFLELSVEELAALYGCSAISIRVRLYRARKKARELIFQRGRNSDVR